MYMKYLGNAYLEAEGGTEEAIKEGSVGTTNSQSGVMKKF